MLVHGLLTVLFVCKVQAVVQNVICPEITPRELDWKELDGKWYLSGVATDIDLKGDCAMMVFNHKSDNTTDVSISWVTNNTASYYNGSVALIEDPNSNGTGDLLMVTFTDNRAETYAFLDVNYEHYAVLFACHNNQDGNSSTYEIWKLTRAPHLKDAVKINQAIANYNLQDTVFLTFNNTEDTCRINGGYHLHPSSLIMTSAAALTLFRRFY